MNHEISNLAIKPMGAILTAIIVKYELPAKEVFDLATIHHDKRRGNSK